MITTAVRCSPCFLAVRLRWTQSHDKSAFRSEDGNVMVSTRDHVWQMQVAAGAGPGTGIGCELHGGWSERMPDG
jgi:hypothetical protein